MQGELHVPPYIEQKVSYSSIEDVAAILQNCESDAQIDFILSQLPKRILVELNSCLPYLGNKLMRGKGSTIIFPDFTCPKPAMVSNWSYVERNNSPAQEHVNQLYSSLFKMVQAAVNKAHDKHKKIQIIVGDMHCDRTGLMIMAMLTYIGARMGITSIGIEVPEEGRQIYNLPTETRFGGGYEKCGLKEMHARYKYGLHMVPDIGGITLDFRTRNFDFIFALANKELKLNVFAGDPKSFADRNRQKPENEKPFEYQEKAMREALAKQGDCIAFYGVGHLDALQHPPKDTYRLLISAQNVFLNCFETQPWPIYKKFVELPVDNAAAVRIGERAGDNIPPLVQVFVEGFIRNKDNALRMAAAADKAIGESLAPGAEWCQATKVNRRGGGCAR